MSANGMLIVKALASTIPSILRYFGDAFFSRLSAIVVSSISAPLALRSDGGIASGAIIVAYPDKGRVFGSKQWKTRARIRKMEQKCWLNGEIIPLSSAKVSVLDIGLLRGFGIYEGLITHNRKPFMLEDHLARMHRSAAKMSLKVPVDDAAIGAAIRELVETNVPAGKEALIRIILTGGTTVGVIDYNPDTPTMFILVDEFSPLESEYVENGCKIEMVEYHRDLSEIKSINYIKTVLLQKERRAKNALELVYVWQGQVLECGGSNIFIVKDGKIITTKDDIVLGITRKVAIDVAKPHYGVEERPISVDEMLSADEVFITGSFKEVVPVIQIGDTKIGNGAPGPVSKHVVELFADFATNY